MNVTKRVGFITGAAAMTLTGVGAAGTGVADENASLRAEVAELRAEMAQLRATSGDSWLTEQRAAEIRSVVQDVLADADTRASLQGAGMTAGYDNGFLIASPDGNFSMRINGQLQVRYIYNYTEEGGFFDGPAFANEDRNRQGFENTRTRLSFEGNVVNPQWKYRLEATVTGSSAENEFDSFLGSSASAAGSFGLDDAYIQYDYQNGFNMYAGQFKDPLLREDLVYSGKQLTVERSNVAHFFSGGKGNRVQGVMGEYRADMWRVMASYNDGVQSLNTPWNTEDTEWSFSGRGELLINGTWDQFEDFTSWRGEEMAFLIGGAARYQKAEYGTGDGTGVPGNDNEAEVFIGTVDVSAEFGGANLFGAFYLANVETESSDDFTPWGFVVQGGFFLTDDWELYGRFEWLDFDVDDTDELGLITLGVNKYFGGHKAKWSTDFGYGIDAVNFADPITGWRVDSIDESGDGEQGEGQFVFRTQLQLMF